jgi:hypothetical protein
MTAALDAHSMWRGSPSQTDPPSDRHPNSLTDRVRPGVGAANGPKAPVAADEPHIAEAQFGTYEMPSFLVFNTLPATD